MSASTTNPPKDEILGNSDAAEYIGVTPRTLEVWRCTKRYQIPFIKVGRLVKYRKSALDAFLESQTVGADG
ncbi:helix-turn-helix domain-containing protein [Methylomonas koyamae]|uniref:helix-turn-helix domain-containing protein n=1 Tax=Methylomonas koyamae TaxID=702114 RepID=UPI002873BF43|nr:helix-turn-helix domain-containing protein [Methylomonas koyamae]WNB74561.1 helix-turn-helix domain-containing protein [Methylomonas koyamae]